MLLQKDNSVPGLYEARRYQAEIKRLGIQDVEFMYDGQIKMWGVCQVRKTNTGIITMDNASGTKVEPYLMWWCKDDKSEYRAPSEQDVSNVIAIVQRSQKWFKPGGGDDLADELDAQDVSKRAEKEKKHRERMAPHVKALKKAIREELG